MKCGHRIQDSGHKTWHLSSDVGRRQGAAILATNNTSLRPPLKKSLFPVQRVVKMMATRAAANSFYFFDKKKTEKFAEKKHPPPQK